MPNKNETKLFYLIYIHSAPSNVERRQAIRNTWAQEGTLSDSEVRLVFVLGLPSGDATTVAKIQSDVIEESKQHGDIIQMEFIDSYKNLTFKATSILKWIVTFCPHADYIIKADDDVFINIYLFTQSLADRYWIKRER